jgi:hypothetical protein
MARIDIVSRDRAGWFVRLAEWFARRRFDKVLEPIGIMGQSPAVLAAAAAYELASERARHLEPRLKVLAGIKAATLIGCPF